MSKYTMELRNVALTVGEDEVLSWFSSYKLEDYLTAKEIKTITDTGLWSKEKLAKKIYNHFYMHEIGVETIALFRHNAKVTMEEIMEEMLPVIYTNAIKYDPLINVDYTETFTRNIESEGSNTGTSNSTSNSNTSGLIVSSNTPQGQISKESILNGDYASSTSANENDSSVNDNTNTNSSALNKTGETYSKNIKGNSGVSATYQKMIEQFRDNIRATDQEIIKRLNVLFFGLL